MFEEDKTIARRLMDEAWSEGRLDVIGEVVASDCHLHDPMFPSLTPGVESMRGPSVRLAPSLLYTPHIP